MASPLRAISCWAAQIWTSGCSSIPSTSGDVLTANACRRRIERINGEPGSLEAEHFRPANVREIAVRVLRNLKAAYAMENHWWDVLPVQQRLTLLLPHVMDEQRDLGLVYLRTGHVSRPSICCRTTSGSPQPEQAEMLAPVLCVPHVACRRR